MENRSLLFMCLAILGSACQSAFSAIQDTENVQKKESKMNSFRRSSVIKKSIYTAKIEGIECALCAESVVTIMQHIDGVSDVSFRQGKRGYEDGVVVFSWDNKKGEVPRSVLSSLLEKEEFKIENLECE